jgi:uridine kinase
MLVGIDGSDGSGKSYFASDLSSSLESNGLTALVVSLDDFLNPKSIRYRQGKQSSIGFYEDSYNLNAIVEGVLNPVVSDRNEVTKTQFDCEHDREDITRASLNYINIVIVEGLFVNRPDFKSYWDMSVYLRTDFSVSVARGNARFGLNPDPKHESNRRYVDGNRIYQQFCNPEQVADYVIDHNDLNNSRIVQTSI